MPPTIGADPSFSPYVHTQRSILTVLGYKSAGFLDMDFREGPGIEIYTIFSRLDTDIVDVLGDYQIQVKRFSGPRDTMWTLVATLVEEVILAETGDFTESSNSEIFTVSVADYDPSCEGTEAFPSGSRVETSSAEDKLP